MIVKKYRFSIATNYIQSKWSEVVEIEFEEDSTEEEREDELNEQYTTWLFENNRGGYSEVE